MSERISLNMSKEYKAQKLLQIFLNGQEIQTIDNERFCYQNGVFGVIREKYINNEYQDSVILSVDAPVSWFLNKFPDEVSEEEIITKLGEKTLMEFNKKDRS